jgi:predicted transcriptional regulator
MLGETAIGVDHLLVGEDVEGCQGCPAGQRVAGVGVRVEKAAAGPVVVKIRIDRIAGHHDRQRQVAAGDAFRQAEEVRADRCLLMGKEGAGAAAADGDLVTDQMHL